MTLARSLLLLLGGALIVASSFFTLGHPTDRVVATVLVPAFVFGLIFIVSAMRIGGAGGTDSGMDGRTRRTPSVVRRSPRLR